MFFLAWIWLVFASIQDIKKTEVANWISYSLISFAFAYRAFYSVFSEKIEIILYGAAGFAIFFVLAHLFYYTRTFAGADAKLLMGIGVILPFENLEGLLVLSLEFIFLLFFLGTIYSIAYSLFLAFRNKEKFMKEFKKDIYAYKNWIFLTGLMAVFIFILFMSWIGGALAIGVFLASMLFIYLKSFEKSCLIVERKSSELMEGDWLEKEIRAGSRIINKSVHGLSKEEIKLLKKYGKKVIIKQGIPFVPAFLLAFSFMVFFWLFLQIPLERMFSLFLWA